MLHTKPQGHWPFGSGEEDFLRVFTIYGCDGHPCHVTQTPRTNFRSLSPSDSDVPTVVGDVTARRSKMHGEFVSLKQRPMASRAVC